MANRSKGHRNHCTNAEMQNRKSIALSIYNEHKDNINFTRGNIVSEIQSELQLPRYMVSKLVLNLGIFPKRESIPHTPSNNPDTRICPKCKTEKPMLDFPKKGLDRKGEVRYSYCKKCHNEYQKVLQLKRVFGLSYEEFLLLGESCSICGRSGKTKRNAVDHNHKTGLIRGRLCDRCNRGLAWFQDNPDLLRKCAEYLENPPAIKILGKSVLGRIGRVSNKRKKKSKTILD